MRGAGKHLIPPVAHVVHVAVGVIAAELWQTLIKAGNKTVTATLVTIQLCLQIPDVGTIQTLQALLWIRLMMVSQAVNVHPYPLAV